MEPKTKEQHIAELLQEQVKFEFLVKEQIDYQNSTFFTLVGQLIFVATVFISLAGIAVVNKDFTLTIGQDGRIFLLSALVLLIGSIASGIWQYATDYNFFAQTAAIRVKIVDKIVETKLLLGDDAGENINLRVALSRFITEIQAKQANTSSLAPIFLQVVLVAISSFLLVLVVSKLLMF